MSPSGYVCSARSSWRRFCSAVGGKGRPWPARALFLRYFLVDVEQTSLFDIDERGILVRVAPLDGVRKIVVPAAFTPRLLHLEHYPRTVAHPGVTRIVRTIRRTHFWPNMAEDVLETVRHCDACARNRITLSRRTNPLELFPANAPLESVVMDILGPLPKTDMGTDFYL
jgi:Integrase zinc binding domain